MIEIMQMGQEHIVPVAELEKLCFSDPWPVEGILPELKNPLSYWLVAMDGERLAGYVGSQSCPPEADVMNVAVAPQYRRRGVAQSLLEALVADLRAREITSLSLEVRTSNEAAIALYSKLGFCQVGRRPYYYRNPREDACILRKEWQI